MAQEQALRRLFYAFRENDRDGFMRAAEAIIADAQASNRHVLARDLRKALQGLTPSMRPETARPNLSTLPHDRRKGLSLLQITESRIDEASIILPTETKSRLQRVLSEQLRSSLLQRSGLTPKRKLLFWGPPGCGKTLAAHYLAHELGLPIGVVRLSAVISSYLGDTAGNLQAVFDQAKDRPMVLLLDEADAIGKNRDDRNDVGELKRVVNTLLQVLDSFDPEKGLVIAATNHQRLLDFALFRRFDDLIGFKMPGPQEREQLMRLHLGHGRFPGSLSYFIKRTASLSFADIKKVVEEALKTAILEGRQTVSHEDLKDALKQHRNALQEAGLRGDRNA